MNKILGFINNLSAFVRYKLAKLNYEVTDIFDIEKKLHKLYVVIDKRHFKFVVLRNIILLISFYSLYQSYLTRSLTWISVTFLCLILLGDVKEYEAGHWKHWLRQKKKKNVGLNENE